MLSERLEHVVRFLSILALSLHFMGCQATVETRETGSTARPSAVDASIEPQEAAVETKRAEPTALDHLRSQLAERFDRWADDPTEYAARVRSECRRFPEGDLFPFTLPAMAYAQMVYEEPARRGAALERMAPLLDRAVTATAAKVRAPGGDLTRLQSYGGHGAYLGQLNLALGSWRLAGGDGRYDALQAHLTDILDAALSERDGLPIRSFPAGLTWPFDSVAAIVSVAAFDRHASTTRAQPLLATHRRWVESAGTEAATKLPVSRVAVNGRVLSGPRGCDLSWRVSLLAQVDEPYASALYERYVEAHWVERDGIVGFSEWPRGRSGRADNDSGPIIRGVGTTASALGLAAAAAAGDRDRLARLADQAVLASRALALGAMTDRRGTVGGFYRYDPDYLTGFLYGDVTLFYAVTWHRWPTPGTSRSR